MDNEKLSLVRYVREELARNVGRPLSYNNQGYSAERRDLPLSHVSIRMGAAQSFLEECLDIS